MSGPTRNGNDGTGPTTDGATPGGGSTPVRAVGNQVPGGPGAAGPGAQRPMGRGPGGWMGRGLRRSMPSHFFGGATSVSARCRGSLART